MHDETREHFEIVGMGNVSQMTIDRVVPQRTATSEARWSPRICLLQLRTTTLQTSV